MKRKYKFGGQTETGLQRIRWGKPEAGQSYCFRDGQYIHCMREDGFWHSGWVGPEWPTGRYGGGRYRL